jgi:hypothetical protein
MAIIEMDHYVKAPSSGGLHDRLREFPAFESSKTGCLALLTSRGAYADVCILRAIKWLQELGVPLEPSMKGVIGEAMNHKTRAFYARVRALSHRWS